LSPILRITSYLPITKCVVNAGGDADFENRRICNFEGLVTLTLDPRSKVTWHSVM